MNATRHPHDRDGDRADPATTLRYTTTDDGEALVLYERGNPRAWIQSSVWDTLGG